MSAALLRGSPLSSRPGVTSLSRRASRPLPPSLMSSNTPNDQQSWRSTTFLLYCSVDVFQSSANDSLIWAGGAFDDSAWCLFGIRAIKKTTVWFGRNAGGSGAAPLRPVPVQIRI
ncbi:hypothetical protein KC345_g25 [Hortaea werneckii]|nr:hypothetical protein KC345_g25 [Hortaea werneckii]